MIDPNNPDNPKNYFSLFRSEGPLDDPSEYCCDFIEQQLDGNCRNREHHSTGTAQCPDQVICYSAKLREYSISPIGLPAYIIHFCPSCGKEFPRELRDEWFDELKTLEIDPWDDQELIPEEFKSDAWWKARGL